jgi:hypothetical protein
MTVMFHPEFAGDVCRFSDQYSSISPTLSEKFRSEMDAAIEAVKTAPLRAGHLLNLNSTVCLEFRRSNLRSFPFFILYSVADDRLFFGSVIPSKSDPLTWLLRFGKVA